MPFEGEFAHYRPLQRVAASPRVRDLLARQRVLSSDDNNFGRPDFSPAARLPADTWRPDWILAIDGSHQPVPVRNGYPVAEVGYVTIASALIDAAKVRELDQQRPTDPAVFRTTQHPESIDAALPGANVIIDDETSATHSLRRALLAATADARMAADGETLLETYEQLLTLKPAGAGQVCPYQDDVDCGVQFAAGSGEYPCSCGRGLPLYSTDALRIHEGMVPDATNGAMFAEIMQSWERLWLVNVLRTLESKGWLRVLTRVALVLDGPLAVFGHPAWLSHAIRRELMRINNELRGVAGADMLLLGIEKTGAAVEHFESLDSPMDDGDSPIPPESYFLLTDEYIKSHIQYSRSEKPYGRDTYFGRKFLYKSSSGSRLVGTLPFLRETQRDLSHATPEDFPRLRSALALMEEFASARYKNALTPLVVAHAEAAIPLHLGKRVLEKLAREIVASEE